MEHCYDIYFFKDGARYHSYVFAPNRKAAKEKFHRKRPLGPEVIVEMRLMKGVRVDD